MSSTLFNLQNKVALVTGASRGLGQKIAEGLAAQGVKVLAAVSTQSPILKVKVVNRSKYKPTYRMLSQ